jgi:pimeloyl-ACP methyl ester carboxylesterase
MLDHVRDSLKINVLAVEYPGYGIYDEPMLGAVGDFGPTEEKILRDAELVLNFALTQTCLSNIIVLGRSLGSGPATHLASKFRVSGLILMSPYTSIKNVAYSKVGMLSFFVPECFNNLEKIKSVECPTFILHG